MRAIITVLALSLLIGCAHSGKKMSTAQLDQIVVGVTTKDEMLSIFGTPRAQSYSSDGKLSVTWMYVYVRAFVMAIKQQNLTVLFDQNNRVEKFSIVDGVNKPTMRQNAIPAQTAAATPAPAAQPMPEAAYKDAQVQQLMQQGLPYGEYQKRYRAIMAE